MITANCYSFYIISISFFIFIFLLGVVNVAQTGLKYASSGIRPRSQLLYYTPYKN